MNYCIVHSNELCHYGVLGMKWGVRKDRVTSGSSGIKNTLRNRAFKIRQPIISENEKPKNSQAGTIYEYKKPKNSPAGTMSENYENERPNYVSAEKIVRNAASIVGNAGKAYNAAARIRSRNEKQKSNRSASEMSDAELRERIQRLNLEKQYRDLSSENLSSGMSAVKDALEIAGGIAAIGVSGVSIYNTIKGR